MRSGLSELSYHVLRLPLQLKMVTVGILDAILNGGGGKNLSLRTKIRTY